MVMHRGRQGDPDASSSEKVCTGGDAWWLSERPQRIIIRPHRCGREHEIEDICLCRWGGIVVILST
ncbi:hypothetical protein BHE97_04110 [Aeromicrobium sp. PE09-221]|nr:hypothetical protein BHE97_04110 [Aeromicrobium sp. PE09-221]